MDESVVIERAHQWDRARTAYLSDVSDPMLLAVFRDAEKALAEAVQRFGISEAARLDPEVARWLGEGGSV